MNSRCCLMIEIDNCVERKPCCSFLGLSLAYFGALACFMIEKIKNVCRNLFNSSGCLGCFTRPQLIIAVDEPSKGLKIQGRSVKKTSLPDDIWSSSYEMDNSAVQSQRSISSMSASNQNLDPHGGSGSTSNPSEFVNNGLLLWNQMRQQWVGDRKSRNQPKMREPRLSWNATYETLLGTNKPFPQPIPLPEMVDFLVDVWEQEGLYD
ncbi:uncharacterized protein LOC110705086 isoform X1 [Chenopodium quinoa]|uniref:uncharacterized protein LOC110705086 isoform X1 n=1 Tax=Chenopodium quinoa TaxID=63459 RepID=UPI000B779028|nr:uncharacterized protein LOC110705086 isoform X1 [Chenopodium quinoa]